MILNKSKNDDSHLKTKKLNQDIEKLEIDYNEKNN